MTELLQESLSDHNLKKFIETAEMLQKKINDAVQNIRWAHKTETYLNNNTETPLIQRNLIESWDNYRFFSLKIWNPKNKQYEHIYNHAGQIISEFQENINGEWVTIDHEPDTQPCEFIGEAPKQLMDTLRNLHNKARA